MNKIGILFFMFTLFCVKVFAQQVNDSIPKETPIVEIQDTTKLSDIKQEVRDSIPLNIEVKKDEQLKTEIDTAAAYKQTENFLRELVEQAEKTAVQNVQINLDITNLIINETISKIGNDFYDYFNTEWQLRGWPDVEGDYIITITERPFRFQTPVVIVTLNDIKVYENFLQPRQDFLEGLALNLVNVTQNYLYNYKEIIKELEGGDMKGTGIY